MDADRWSTIERLYHEALARPAGEQGAFLSQACGGDDALRHEVESLLAHDGDASFLSTPAVAFGDGPAIHIGQTLGSYLISGRLGEGGMGEVYRARDTTLRREVAIKVLPAIFASDAERLVRFTREARMLAALNHPHIGAIYGVEESDGIRALILELVEGPTLADRLANGPLAITEALPIAKQIADALEAAHEKGIVHRDLKPANIKITPDGVVKVLDFGLAKAAAGDGAASQDVSQSPTVTVGGTREGIILGTAAYMSPEQARGQAVDKRTDIWAFGCVLYEMLTGRTAFAGATITDTLAAILEREPEWNALPVATPASVRRLLQRCLEKDRAQRIGDMSIALFLLNEPTVAPSSTRNRRPSVSWSLATIVALTTLIAAGAFSYWSRSAGLATAPPVTRLTIAPSDSSALPVDVPDRILAISPDGAHVAFVTGIPPNRLFVRAMDQLEDRQITGVAAARTLFFSPDGRWIGFFDDTSFKKVAISGGPAEIICRGDGSAARGATWGPDGSIIFGTSDNASGLWRCRVGEGVPTMLTKPDHGRGEGDHLWPEFLPDGRHVLFTIAPTTGGMGNAIVAVLDVGTGTQKELIRGGIHAHYTPSGHLVYGGAGTLRAVTFDLNKLEAVGTPVALVSQVVTTPGAPAGHFDVARNGTLVYVSGSQGALSPARRLVMVDRQGNEQTIAAPPRPYSNPRLSPDDTRIAVAIHDQENDIWIWDSRRATLAKLTSGPAADLSPTWMPDGRRLVFASYRAGYPNLFWMAADGTGTPEPLAKNPRQQAPTAVAPDGHWVLASSRMNLRISLSDLLTQRADR